MQTISCDNNCWRVRALKIFMYGNPITKCMYVINHFICLMNMSQNVNIFIACSRHEHTHTIFKVPLPNSDSMPRHACMQYAPYY